MGEYYDYFEWYHFKATPEERELSDKVFNFAELFDDMRFENGTEPYKMTQVKTLIDGEWREVGDSLPEELECFDYEQFHYKVEPSVELNGYYNREDCVLSVTPESVKKDSVVLHEMIHMHESVINELPLYYHDTLYWAMYQSLRDKIEGLDEAITQHSYLLNGTIIYSMGGLHDILFLLKSFDLDIRQGYPLGTVFGYGGVDDFKTLKYTK